MQGRLVSPLLVLLALGALGLCAMLALQMHRPVEESGLSRDPGHDAGPPRNDAASLPPAAPPRSGTADPGPGPPHPDGGAGSRGGNARQPLIPGERPPEGEGRDELFAKSPERPEPGALDGPLVKLLYDDGTPCFEAEQIQDSDGIWVLHGRWTSWFENGQIQEQGWYDRHRESGDWLWWDDNGQQIAQGSFHEGRREGAWTFWYSNGVKQMDARYAAGEGQGMWTLYFDDGQKWAEGQYLGGEISGYWTIWDEFGAVNPERSGVYEQGKRISD